MPRKIKAGFDDLESLKSELGPDVGAYSDDQLREMVQENLLERSKLTESQRAHMLGPITEDYSNEGVVRKVMENERAMAKQERERFKRQADEEKTRLANELAAEKNKPKMYIDMSELGVAKNRLASELEAERLRRLYGVNYLYRSPTSFEDYLVKERIKREVKDDLKEEKQREKREKELAKLWAPAKKPAARKPSKPRAKSKTKPRAKSKGKAKKK